MTPLGKAHYFPEDALSPEELMLQNTLWWSSNYARVYDKNYKKRTPASYTLKIKSHNMLYDCLLKK